MWDNRIGKRNPKAPDFKCRDRSCDGVIWPPKGQVAKAAAPAGDQAEAPAAEAPAAAAPVAVARRAVRAGAGRLLVNGIRGMLAAPS
jgi:hypothetical protein